MNILSLSAVNKNIINHVITEDNSELSCPHCKSTNRIVKNGKNKDTQRYLCKHCGKSFIKNTNTPLYYSKKTLDIWEEYISLLMKSYSLRKIAKLLSISINTAFFWRHKILDAIREHYSSTELTNNVEISKMSFKPSFKGNYSNENSITLHNYLSTGLNICVLTAVDDTNHLTITPVTEGILKVSDITRVLSPQIEKCKKIITKTFLPYHYLCDKYKKTHICMESSILTHHHMSEMYSLSNVYEVQHSIYSFLRPYKNVSTKYLANYLILYKYIKEKITSNVLFLKGMNSYAEKAFKNRMPIFS